jgi:hypothetical protein
LGSTISVIGTVVLDRELRWRTGTGAGAGATGTTAGAGETVVITGDDEITPETTVWGSAATWAPVLVGVERWLTVARR